MITLFDPLLPTPDRQLVRWQQLYGSGLGLVITQALKKTHALIVVVRDARIAQRIEDQIRFFLNDSNAVPVFRFPDWECLPYDNFSPHPDIVSQRLQTLHRLPSLTQGITIVTAGTILQRIASNEYIQNHVFSLRVGERLEIDRLRMQLQTAGYHAVNQTMAPGEYSVRGGLVDIFPTGSKHPFRVDLFDEQIESIRFFDPDTQRSKNNVQSIELLPAREFPLDAQGIKCFRRAFRRLFSGDPQRYSIYRDVSNGLAPAGIEFYLPLFFENTASFLDYLPKHAVLMFVEDIEDALKLSSAEVNDRYLNGIIDKDKALVSPDRLFFSAEQIVDRLNQYPRIQVHAFSKQDLPDSCRYGFQPVPEFSVNSRAQFPYEKFFDFLNTFAGRVLLVAETAGRRENLLGLLRDQSLTATVINSWKSFLQSSEKLAITIGSLEQGLLLESPNVAVVTEGELYGERVLQKRRRSATSQDPESVIRSLAELLIGDPVVHEEHGVGRYQGLNVLTIQGNQTEFLTLEYYGGDKLYIPVLSLNSVSRFIGANADTAPLHKLGGDSWTKAKQRAKQRAYDVATELLEVEAMRNLRKGFSFPRPDSAYKSFSEEFTFEETPDQAQAIEDVISDMCSDKTMNRLVCGDVGFGKTEVALRATFLALQGNKQIVILAPTTLLAQQHYDNFVDRFAGQPINIELLSRFRSHKQQSDILKKLKEGTIDIIIGTHRLFQRDVCFKRLGLIVIDEEHRFGVRQKEQLKKLRTQADVLTLTATPIPRTLNLALSGLRDISIIATAPRARLSIKTFVREWNQTFILEGCLRELRRGGQVYYVHNEVRTIDKHREALQQLLPEADIRVAHGQLRESELENIMSEFYHQRFSILLCTTIIESGIDVPTANTIFINRADRFGLSQLHQLRGRVGRSHHQAYAYLMIPPLRALTSDAVKRLQAIESLEDLGAGFALASHDLEIRGAGELLGESQSGTIDEIGFTMYAEYLNRAISTIKSLEARTSTHLEAERSELEINLHVPALFPETYLPDVHMRLMMYKRLSGVSKLEQLRELQIEVIDRFGFLPPPAKMLFRLTELRIKLAPLDLNRLDIGPKGGRVVFSSNPNIDASLLIDLIQSQPAKYSMINSNTLKMIADFSEPDARFIAADDLLKLVN